MSRCRYMDCLEEIVWAVEQVGNNFFRVPVDAESLTGEDAEAQHRGETLEFRPGDHICHLHTCKHRFKL